MADKNRFIDDIEPDIDSFGSDDFGGDDYACEDLYIEKYKEYNSRLRNAQTAQEFIITYLELYIQTLNSEDDEFGEVVLNVSRNVFEEIEENINKGNIRIPSTEYSVN